MGQFREKYFKISSTKSVLKQILVYIGYFHDQVLLSSFFCEDLVVQIAMYNTLEGDIFHLSALKPENLGDLIALKRNSWKLLIFKFKVFNT